MSRWIGRSYLLFVIGLSLHIAVSASANSSEAEVESYSKNIRVNPLGVLFGGLSASMDFKISDNLTVGPQFSYFSAGLFATKLSGLGLGGRMNYYFSSDALSTGWYLGPELGLSRISVLVPGAKANSTGIYVGAMVGRQWVWKSGVNFSVGLGATWHSHKSALVASNSSFELSVPFYHGIVPSGEISLGYAF